VTNDEHPPDDARPKRRSADTEPDGAPVSGPRAHGDAASADSETDDESLPRLLAALSEQIGEIREQLERLLSVQLDRLKLRFRSGLFWALTGLLLGAVCVAATTAAVLYLLEGTAGMFTALFGGNAWAGDLVAGALVLLVALLALATIGGRHRKRELQRLKRKYEPGSTKGEAR
jgi:hypothetical protein